MRHPENAIMRIGFDPAWHAIPYVRGGGILLARSCIELRPHRHAGYEITYVADGEVTWELEDGTTLHLTGGDLAIVQPDVVHGGEYQVIRPCALLWVVLDLVGVAVSEGEGVLLADEVAHMDRALAHAGNRVAHGAPRLHRAFGELAQGVRWLDAGSGTWLDRVAFRAQLSLFLAHALCDLTTETHAAESEQIARARQYMARHLDQRIDLRDVARACGLSISHFHARFKAEVGQTPGDYLCRLRCARAAELIAATEASITAIAHEVGLCGSQHLATCFRKYYGMTPTAFRAKHRS